MQWVMGARTALSLSFHFCRDLPFETVGDSYAQFIHAFIMYTYIRIHFFFLDGDTNFDNIEFQLPGRFSFEMILFCC